MALPGTLIFGQNADVDTSAEQLVTSETLIYSGVVIVNTSADDFIYIGSANDITSSTGFPIPPLGQQALDVGLIPLNSDGKADLSMLYVVAGTANTAVGYMGR